MTRPHRTAHADLVRAREALAAARAKHADPWRLAELTAKYDAALERALEDGDGPGELALATVARTPAPALPLAWLDESVPARARRGES